VSSAERDGWRTPARPEPVAPQGERCGRGPEGFRKVPGIRVPSALRLRLRIRRLFESPRSGRRGTAGHGPSRPPRDSEAVRTTPRTTPRRPTPRRAAARETPAPRRAAAQVLLRRAPRPGQCGREAGRLVLLERSPTSSFLQCPNSPNASRRTRGDPASSADSFPPHAQPNLEPRRPRPVLRPRPRPPRCRSLATRAYLVGEPLALTQSPAPRSGPAANRAVLNTEVPRSSVAAVRLATRAYLVGEPLALTQSPAPRSGVVLVCSRLGPTSSGTPSRGRARRLLGPARPRTWPCSTWNSHAASDSSARPPRAMSRRLRTPRRANPRDRRTSDIAAVTRFC
jgi:hypothetical protein